MKERFFDVLAVFSYSTRTQVAVLMGIVCFFVIHFSGINTLDQLQLDGPVSSLTQRIRECFAYNHDLLAWTSLTGFWWLAARLYRRDKRKLSPYREEKFLRE